MINFQHVDAPDIRSAVALLLEEDSAAIAGGTDLLSEMKARIRAPARLVNLKTIPEMGSIRPESDGVRIGALTKVNTIENDPLVGARFPGLRQAASMVASPQLRNMGTLGGNLCQHVRCWYYRHPDVPCWLKGGETCYAREGLNHHHSIFGKAPCVAVNPSDLAPALLALDASVSIAGSEGEKEMPFQDFYRLPDATHRNQVILEPGELVTGVSIPSRSGDTGGVFIKKMVRAAWSFALVSVAVQIQWQRDMVADARIVLGGVAGRPWRAEKTEESLRGRCIDEKAAREAGEAAVTGAKPLAENQYKVSLVKNLVKRALLGLAASRES